MYYQEGLTSNWDKRSERPPTDEDCSLGDKGGGEEQGAQPDHQATSYQEEVRPLDTPHGGAYRPVQEGAGRNKKLPSRPRVGQEGGYWEER